MKRPKD